MPREAMAHKTSSVSGRWVEQNLQDGPTVSWILCEKMCLPAELT